MILRSLLAAAVVAATVASSTAAVGDCRAWSSPTPDVLNFPRPMPSRTEMPETLDDAWQLLRDWLRPKLGLSPVVPVELH